MSGQDSPLYKRVNVLCSECGVELKREPSVVQNREEHYCSRECYYRNYTAENAPGWKGGNPSYYGPSWDTQREKAVERDGYQCQECGMEREKHREKWGSDLEVHHIEPLRKFNDTKKANQLENLITVCKICHLTMEHSTQNGSTISIHSD